MPEIASPNSNTNRDGTFVLGRFPVISLQDARNEAKRLVAEFTLGRLHPQNTSVKAAIGDYLSEKTKECRPRTVADYRWLLNRHFMFTGHIGDITTAQVSQRLAKLPSGQYNHALTAGRIFFNWCLKRRYITHNPFDGLSKHQRTPRSRLLTDDELKSIWRACEQSRRNGALDPVDREIPVPPTLPVSFARIVQLLILTALRRGECAAIQAEHIQSEYLVLPPSLTKNGREHVLPLTPLAKNVLHYSSDGFVFPGKSTNKAFNGWSKAKSALDDLSGASNWTLHDIRRTVATRMAELGVAPHVIERLLNHVSGQISGVAAVYNRARYLDEMRDALKLWESRLKALLASEP